MGVTGLWRLVEPAGKPVPVETLENKVLAVDISIWLHQVVKGYQDAKGAPLPNAHLMGLFQRLCKLLYFRIKPVFVFDGCFPELKKETIARRQDNKAKYNSESERIKRELAILLSKKTAVSSLLGKKVSPKKVGAIDNANNDDMFKLPALPQKEEETESESEEEESSGSSIDLHTADIESEAFKKLSVKEKYELLIELKETRKMNSWGRLHELPKKSDSFSDFQMQRLLKRRKVQECLEETEKEMEHSGMSLNDLELLLNEEGIDTKIDNLPTRRIASNNTTRYLLINNVREALAEMKRKKEAENNTETTPTEIPSTSKIIEYQEDPDEDLEKAIAMSLECQDDEDSTEKISTPKEETKRDELDEDLEKAIKISLECNNDNDKNAHAKADDSWTSFLSDSDHSYSDSEDEFQPPDLSSAKAYIMQYSDFTNNVIDDICTLKTNNKSKPKAPSVNQIIEELKQTKPIIVDNVDISSDEAEVPQNKAPDVKHPERTEPKIVVGNEMSECSIICVDKTQDIISLDTSSELNDSICKVINSETDHNTTNTSQKDSDSSEDEFEEVPDIDPIAMKTVVQLNLEVGTSAPEDDIFADIFENKHVSDNTQKDSIELKTNIENNRDILKNPVILENLETPSKLESITVKESVNLKVPSPDNEKHISEPVVLEQNSSKNMQAIKDIQKTPIKEKLTETQLNTMVEEIQHEEEELIQEKSRLDRIGRNITEQMTREAQELLQVFGIPYIVAPMEAEAQCAFLETAKLTDGTITDDSDIWLFGGRTVYKNFFNQKKHVLQFLAERIEQSFNLTREQLILLAMLVGSDYTTGLTGVGPVTAMEILASFPHKKGKLDEEAAQSRYTQLVTGLQEFKSWLRAGRRTDNISLKKKLKNVNVTDDFPSLRVVQAYMEPNVDKNKEKFSWGELDITILRDYAKQKFGWNQHKLDEIIKPVLKRLQDRKNQKTVHDYFGRKVNFQSLEDQMSKRVKAAVQRMGPDQPTGQLSEESNVEKTKVPSKRKPRSKKESTEGDATKPGPSKPKQRKKNEELPPQHSLSIVSQIQDNKPGVDIIIPKTGRTQEIIPQKQKDMKNLLENKMRAIEIFRKSKIDTKHKRAKRRPNLPKDKADLSESSDGD